MRELYVRAEGTHGKFSVVPGVQFFPHEPEDDVMVMYKHLKWAAGVIAWGHAPNHIAAYKAMEKWILKKYPGRAYFVETDQEGVGVQVYDPRDFVKERCACNDHRVAEADKERPVAWED